MSFYRMAVQRPPSIGASDSAPFVSRQQGTQQQEMRAAAPHCNTLCKAPIAHADATQKMRDHLEVLVCSRQLGAHSGNRQ